MLTDITSNLVTDLSSNLIVGAGLFDTVQNLATEFKATILIVLGALTVLSAMIAYVRSSGNWPKTIGAFVLGGVVIWLANSGMDWAAQKTGDTIKEASGIVQIN